MYLLKKPLPPAYIMVLKEVKRALRRDDHRYRHRQRQRHRHPRVSSQARMVYSLEGLSGKYTLVASSESDAQG